MARLPRFERGTCRLGGGCSILLSYRREGAGPILRSIAGARINRAVLSRSPIALPYRTPLSHPPVALY